MTPGLLGVNAFHGDASAALLANGDLRAAVEEERFSRVKHWAGFPERAIRWSVAQLGNGGLESLEAVAVSRKPDAYVMQKALLALQNPKSLRRAIRRVRNLAAVSSLEERLRRTFGADRCPKVYPVEHHLAHIASAFFCSPFDEAACLTVDGFGDFVSTMLAAGRGERIEVLDRVFFPHSLGLFYTALTQYLGFPKYGDEYKVMGLAAYGEPGLVEHLRQVVPERADGTFALDLAFFRHLSEGVDMTWEDGEPRLGDVFTDSLERLLGPRRRPDQPVEQRHQDIAASLQAVYEERFFALVREVLARTGLKRLCLAGGCAMNSVANGKLFDQTEVEEVYIQAAAGDAGTALGAALYVQHHLLERPRSFVMEHCYWGPAWSEGDIRAALAQQIPGSGGGEGRHGDITIRRQVDRQRMVEETAEALAGGEVIGWFQGRSEWGPRALGNRSILADPRHAGMRELLNCKIKRRESFRPFAPSILEERTADWFTIDYPDPFMIKVYPLRPEKRSEVPAVTHVDGTGRLQTVSKSTNPLYWSLIRAFEQSTGIPMVLNTSFNENEPIVNSPAEALDCFLRTSMDRLVMENMVLSRTS